MIESLCLLVSCIVLIELGNVKNELEQFNESVDEIDAFLSMTKYYKDKYVSFYGDSITTYSDTLPSGIYPE